MKRRKNSKIMLGLLIAVVALGVGYAAITGVNLLINGSASIKSNGNFSVRFVRPIASETAIDNAQENAITISGYNADESAMNVSEMSASVTDDTHATFAVGALDTVGEYVDFTYTVVNESDEGIDAALSLEVADENDLADYFEITKSVAKNRITSNETTTVTVRIKLVGQPKVSDAEATFKVTLTATPVEEGIGISGGDSGASESGLSGPTLVAAQVGDTHKGIIYLDPTDLTKTCTESDVIANYTENGKNGLPTEIKTGCMKWYIYDDSGDSYKMILDHNTTATVSFNKIWGNVDYENSLIKSTVDALVTSYDWKTTPRLITIYEINTITGKEEFDASSPTMSWYYIDSKTTTKTTNSQGSSRFAWIYDYTSDCTSSGCNIDDSSTEGYWTSTPVNSSGSSNYIWYVDRLNQIYYGDANTGGKWHGVRPVITIDKSILN